MRGVSLRVGNRQRPPRSPFSPRLPLPLHCPLSIVYIYDATLTARARHARADRVHERAHAVVRNVPQRRPAERRLLPERKRLEPQLRQRQRAERAQLVGLQRRALRDHFEGAQSGQSGEAPERVVEVGGRLDDVRQAAQRGAVDVVGSC